MRGNKSRAVLFNTVHYYTVSNMKASGLLSNVETPAFDAPRVRRML